MSTFSSLTAPLLLRRRRREYADAVGDDRERDDTSASIVLYSFPEEFIRHVCGNAPQSCGFDRISRGGDSIMDTQAGDIAFSPLLLPHEWTFAFSPCPDTAMGWHAVRTNRLDYVLQMWSQMTTHLLSPSMNKGMGVSFFPARLPTCIVPYLNDHSCNSTYHEVRAHIPIHLVHSSLLDDGSVGKHVDDFDTLMKFSTSRVMYSRRLRSLIHDAAMSFMSVAVRCVPTVARDELPQDEKTTTIVGDGDNGEDTSDCVCSCKTMNFKPFHHLLLPPSNALEPPTPIVLTLGIENCDTPLEVDKEDESKTSTGDGVRGKDVKLSIHAVVRVTRTRAGDGPHWKPEMLAFESLTSLFPMRFAVMGASAIEVGEIGVDGCVSAWVQRTGLQVFRAWQQQRDTWDRLPPSPKPLPPQISTATPPGSVKTQHDPYGVLTQSPTSHESHTLESRNPESMEEGEENRSVSGELECNGSNLFLHKMDRVLDPLTDSPETTGVEVAGTSVVGEEEDEDEGEGEEELVMDETNHAILSLAQDLSECRRRGTEMLQAVQCQLFSLLSPLPSEKQITSGRRKNRGAKYGNEKETGALNFLCLFFGTNAKAENEDERIQQAITTFANRSHGPNNTYTTFDECVKDAVEMIQELEGRLRAEPFVIMSVRQQHSKNIINGGVTAKSGRKRKDGVSLFAAATKCLTMENYRPSGTACKKSFGKNNGESEDVITVLRCSSSAIVGARQAIGDTLEKLQMAVAWGRQRVMDIKFISQLCQEVIAPCVEAHTTLVKAEQKERAQLKTDYLLCLAIAREAISAVHNTTGREEKEEEEKKSIADSAGVRALNGATRKCNEDTPEVVSEEFERQDEEVKTRRNGYTDGLKQTSAKDAARTASFADPSVAIVAATKKRRKNGATSNPNPRPQLTGLRVPAPVVNAPLKKRKNDSNSGVKKSFFSPREAATQMGVLNLALSVFLFLCVLGAIAFFYHEK
ncbi:hypothetical protein MOQ_008288 [Trypanosoma cruzi marinkellei]|uniref:Uncharacterized protein n=1 Tax=Trypanosoma cruzi marinkellei TaxID=85056 RepID=K2LZ66_TRYCR|nr:hypothetical protein MOQ_008288 [Trypanosoma cruzi marinkellei]